MTKAVQIDLHIEEQINRVHRNNLFGQEAQYIAESCRANKLTHILDLGSWVGELAQEVLATGIALDSYHLVDGIPYYLNYARQRLTNYATVSYQECMILPRAYSRNIPETILVNPYDTLNSSSLYSEYLLSKRARLASVPMEIGPSATVNQFIDSNLSRFGSDTYVKIDLSGVDIELVASILKRQLTPGALQFTVWATDKSVYHQLVNLLLSRGYKVPLANLDIHKNFSVSVSKNHWFAVAHDIIGHQHFSTYYDQAHGVVPFLAS